MEIHHYVRQVSKSLTAQGLINLGKLLERSRLTLKDEKSGRSFGYRRLSALIKTRTGVSVGKDTLQRLELGQIKQPSPDTMLALAGARYILDKEGNPYSVETLLKIATEEIVLEGDLQETETTLSNTQENADDDN